MRVIGRFALISSLHREIGQASPIRLPNKKAHFYQNKDNNHLTYIEIPIQYILFYFLIFNTKDVMRRYQSNKITKKGFTTLKFYLNYSILMGVLFFVCSKCTTFFCATRSNKTWNLLYSIQRSTKCANRLRFLTTQREWFSVQFLYPTKSYIFQHTVSHN